MTTTTTVTQTTTTSSTTQFGSANRQLPSSPERLFYDRIVKLGQIAKTYRSWNDERVSFPLHQWIVQALKTYVRTPLSGDALQTDIQQRLQSLSELLVDSLYQTPVEEAMIDGPWIWPKDVLEKFQRLAPIFGKVKYHRDGAFFSPIDEELMQPQDHLFMNAMGIWLHSLPMHLIDPTIRPTHEQTDEIKREPSAMQPNEQALSSLTVPPVDLLDMLWFFSLVKVAKCAYERVFQTERAETTEGDRQRFQEAMDRMITEGQVLAEQMKEEQIAFEATIRKQLRTYKRTVEADKTKLKHQITDLKTQNASNAHTISHLTATVQSLSSEVGELRIAREQNRTETVHIYHKSQRSSNFCSLM